MTKRFRDIISRITKKPVQLLFNVSERRMRNAKPNKYTEVFYPDPMEPGKARVVGFVDTDATERACAELRKRAPDLRVTRNAVDGKLMHVASVDAEVLDIFFGGPKWRNAPEEELKTMLARFFAAHPEFTVQKPRTLGLTRS